MIALKTLKVIGFFIISMWSKNWIFVCTRYRYFRLTLYFCRFSLILCLIFTSQRHYFLFKVSSQGVKVIKLPVRLKIQTNLMGLSMLLTNASCFIFRSHLNVTFQNTPSPSFFAAIDPQGALQEVGWFLYPSMSFINWQTQW